MHAVNRERRVAPEKWSAWDDGLKIQLWRARCSVILQHPKIAVIGSLNVDHMLRVPHIRVIRG